MGRKSLPTQLKVIQGTNRPDRNPDEPQFEGVHVMPPPPMTLNIDGAEMWNRLGEQLVTQKVLTNVDLYALEQLCYAWQRFRQKAKAGLDLMAAEDNALKTLFAEFGLTPAARRKVANATSQTDKNNPFSKLGGAKAKAPT